MNRPSGEPPRPVRDPARLKSDLDAFGYRVINDARAAAGDVNPNPPSRP